jgi:hypothetical protein
MVSTSVRDLAECRDARAMDVAEPFRDRALRLPLDAGLHVRFVLAVLRFGLRLVLLGVGARLQRLPEGRLVPFRELRLGDVVLGHRLVGRPAIRGVVETLGRERRGNDRRGRHPGRPRARFFGLEGRLRRRRLRARRDFGGARILQRPDRRVALRPELALHRGARRLRAALDDLVGGGFGGGLRRRVFDRFLERALERRARDLPRLLARRVQIADGRRRRGSFLFRPGMDGGGLRGMHRGAGRRVLARTRRALVNRADRRRHRFARRRRLCGLGFRRRCSTGRTDGAFRLLWFRRARCGSRRRRRFLAGSGTCRRRRTWSSRRLRRRGCRCAGFSVRYLRRCGGRWRGAWRWDRGGPASRRRS